MTPVHKKTRIDAPDPFVAGSIYEKRSHHVQILLPNISRPVDVVYHSLM